MEMVDKILKNPKYTEYLERNAHAEKDRKFCCHDIQHALDVARVAYIIALENNCDIGKDIIYAAALLHDIAKWKQYTEGFDHALEGAVLAKEILDDIGADEKMSAMILDAIKSHRSKEDKNTLLSTLLYAGDKACRLCTLCDAIDECNRFLDGREPLLIY